MLTTLHLFDPSRFNSIVKPLGMKKGDLKPFVHALDFATPVPYVMVFCGGCDAHSSMAPYLTLGML